MRLGNQGMMVLSSEALKSTGRIREKYVFMIFNKTSFYTGFNITCRIISSFSQEKKTCETGRLKKSCAICRHKCLESIDKLLIFFCTEMYLPVSLPKNMFLWWIILVSHLQPLRYKASPPISEFKSVVCSMDFERM